MKNDLLSVDKASIAENLVMDTIDDDFFLFDHISSAPALRYPAKMTTAMSVICLSGTMEVSIDLKRYALRAPNYIVILPEQILQTHSRSNDFSGLFVVMSKSFVNSIRLNIQDTVPIFFYLKENPSTTLTPSELDLLLSYYSLLQQTMKMNDAALKKEIIRHLVHAFFYGTNSIFQNHRDIGKTRKSRKETLFDDFVKLVAAHHRDCREVRFYAGKLRLTPKHFSSVVKEVSGRTAREWIDDFVVLEAKALLKSTNMTIQQISEELNFPSQSFFGKYFKRVVGVSPKEYQKT
ncbi:Arabinose operon regulatory protein [termite gut metagenome]|uniref:Arabinose operon regulatory protein n=1 Tax=termite gut metagenome TaxID=433724 RepID=A0A5J4SDB1_9ZZZZ